MNKIYRTVWNEALGAWVAASELTKLSHGGATGSSVEARDSRSVRKALRFSALFVAVVVVFGGRPNVAEAQYQNGLCASTAGSTISEYDNVGGFTNTCSNVGNPIVGTVSSSNSPSNVVFITSQGTQVEVDGDTGAIYFRAGGSSGNFLTMTNVASAGPVGGVLLSGVAAGALNATSTQAVNGSQLYTTNSNVSSLSTIVSGFSTSISTANSNVTSLSTTVSGLSTGLSTAQSGVNSLSTGLSTTNSNVAQLSTSTSTGISTAQSGVTSLSTGLSTTNSNIASLSTGLSTVSNDVANLSTSLASGNIGPVQQTGTANTLALVAPGGTGANPGAAQKLTNVADGDVSANSTDAVNGSQLYAVQQQVNTLSTSLIGQANNQGSSTGTNSNANGANSNAPGGNATATGQNSNASGNNSTATGEGSNASGNNATATGQGATASGENSTADGQGAIASGDNSKADGQNAQATGGNSTALGQGTLASGDNSTATGQGAVASGSNSIAVGQGATASGAGSTALGSNAQAPGANSVAIGAGSVANEANTVSFGSSGNERRLTNVAPGVNGTDAVNMNQLWGVQSSVNQVARAAYSGVAAATALTMIPGVDPGNTISVGIGAATYQGYAASAIGITARVTANLTVRAGAGISASGTSYGAGMSYQW